MNISKYCIILCITAWAVVLCKTIIQTRKNTMSNNQTNLLEVIKTKATSGSLTTQDKREKPIILKWYIRSTSDPDFNDLMKSISSLAIQAFASVELEFLKKFPEALKTERMYQSITLEADSDNQDAYWKEIASKLGHIINQMYTKTDWSKFPSEDLYIFVTAWDAESKKQLGFITFFMRPHYPYGTIKVTAIGVLPEAQGKGLGKLLMSSVFSIIPEIQKVFLCTRVTNQNALRAYRSWGFTQDKEPIKEPGHVFDPAYWTFMEYQTNKSKALQTLATQVK